MQGLAGVKRGGVRGSVSVDGQDELSGVVETEAGGQGVIYGVRRGGTAKALSRFVNMFWRNTCGYTSLIKRWLETDMCVEEIKRWEGSGRD